jgi:hypothetical protein
MTAVSEHDGATVEHPQVPSVGSATRALSVAGVVATTTAVIGPVGSAIGELLPARVLMLLGAGALFAYARPEWRVAIASGVGLLSLALMNPVFSLYFLILLGALLLVRQRPVPFLVVLVSIAIVAPKMAFQLHYHQPGYWNWINEPSLTLALLVSAMWLLRRRAAGRPGSPAPQEDPLSFLLYYLFPSHSTNPMVFSPALLSRERWIDVRAILTLLGWFVVKAGALLALRRLGPPAFLSGLGAGDFTTVSRAALWGMVIASYLETCLSLAATADIPILLGRLFGFPLPDPFRYPLLAWNPVELWRRWGIYNRNVLLQLVYFPLGGSRRRKYLNVMLTFLASALVLHSGWFGSKYWHVGPAGWRDQSIYFLLQGAAVCACLAIWDWTGRRPGKEARPRLSFGLVAAIAGTQAWSALAHVMILAHNIELGERARLVARCIGIG